MNRIDQLIAEMCPDGVEYRKLNDIGELYSGLTGKSKDDFRDGNARYVSYMNVFSNLRVDTHRDDFVSVGPAEKQRAVQKGDILFTASSESKAEVGMSSVLTVNPDQPLYLNSFCFGFRLIDSDLLDPEFSKYLFRSETIRKKIAKCSSGVTRFNISKSRFLEIEIPLPPLSIQREIVKILDTFTELEVELEAQLQAELEARKKQYEYYRDELLTFEEDEVEWKTLGEVATNLDSKRKPVTKSSRDKGEYPYFGASGIVDYVSDYIFDGDYLLVSEDGANLLARTTPIAFSISGKTWVNNHAHVLEFQHVETRKLVEYYLNSIDLTQYITGAAQPKLNKASLSQIPVPIPSLADQGRIVSSLEKFDALVNDLSSGLPAEIAARRKQYEHYRDRLLTFKEKVA